MFAKPLADSGGADEIVDTIVAMPPADAAVAMALVGSIIGLPMFFEIGLVLLMPVIYLVARRSGLSLVTVGIPALAGLGDARVRAAASRAVDRRRLLNADLGLTLGLGGWWRSRRSWWPDRCSASWPAGGWWSAHRTRSTPTGRPATETTPMVPDPVARRSRLTLFHRAAARWC